MFPKVIVFLFALAFAAEAITNRVKREELDEEDDMDNGKAVDENRTAEYWTYSRNCRACNDVHGLKFDGEKARIQGICGRNLLAADLADRVNVSISTVQMPNVPTGNKIGDLTIEYNGNTYVITMHCEVRVNGALVGLPYLTLTVGIWKVGDRVYFRIWKAFFLVYRDCHARCVYISVGHAATGNMKGICGNNNFVVNDDGPIGDWMTGCA